MSENKPGRPKGPAKETNWTNTAITVRKPILQKTLEDSFGNITFAAKKLGINRVYCSNLVKKFGLSAYAANLRIKNTGHDRGRPWD